MLESHATIQADFDRIALLPSKDGWSHNNHYHSFLLSVLPRCRRALDVGCGKGAFSRLLAGRTDYVLGLDLSPQMIQLAQERSQQISNVDYLVADFMTWELPDEPFDCIVSIATLHHLPLADCLQKMKQALRPGGKLAVLDLFYGSGLLDLLISAVALPADVAMRLIRNGRLRVSKAARDAWAIHSRHEHYLTLAQIREVCAKVLPGARVRRHLFWRYSIVWRAE